MAGSPAAARQQQQFRGEHHPLSRRQARTGGTRLGSDLAEAIAGDVLFDEGSRALYATDASNYRQIPIGIVLPRSKGDVVAVVEVCRRHEVPILSRGCGTSLSGETCNEAVILDFSRYLDRVVELDPQKRLARVEPGCILDTLRKAAAPYGLTFGPDPATHDHCTFGGMIGNNSGGVHALMNGITVHNIRSLEILTCDGARFTVGPTSPEELQELLEAGGRQAEIYAALDRLRRDYGPAIRAGYPQIPRRVSGYENLDQLFEENGFNVARALVGTEGTCVTILEATVELIPDPPARVSAILGFPDIYAAADAVPRVLEHKPIGLEGMDHLLADFVRRKEVDAEALSLLPEGKGWLICQMGGDTEEEAVGKAQVLIDALSGEQVTGRVLRKPQERSRVWDVRESALGATAWVPDSEDTWPGWEDSAVHRDNLGDYLRDLKALLHRYEYEASFYGHFGDGLVHCRIDFELRNRKGVEHWRRFLSEAAELVARYDGSLSGEHGDGQARAAMLGKIYEPNLIACFHAFKAIWDPQGRMNPGKVLEARSPTADLRVGPDFQPPAVETFFAYPHDRGSFARAAMRCVGVGKCRRLDSDNGVMCPSFMVTRDERHSTRGRAHLLFEMMHGGVVDGGWQSEEVEEALELCLACKACKSDCPVNVDMATYKAEFRAHYYKNRLRPRSAYSMGLIYWWARIASKVPALANLVTRSPGIGKLAKLAGGIASDRQLPPFARRTFRDWFRQRSRPAGRERVLLWPDTFSNFFRPQTAIAATEVLEAAGFEVMLPPRPLCCGRPLYDQGMLKTAKRLWEQTFDALSEVIDAGIPVIGLEPACTTAFKDELPNLFPNSEAARRLSEQTVYFADFLARHLDRLDLEAQGRRVLVQVHCNHHAVLKVAGERELLERLGVEFDIAPAGCCGMAGAFGFAKETYEVGLAAGERVLLPMVRELDDDVLVLADGFSCREQIEQGTGRHTLHIAELVNALRKPERRHPA